MLWPYGRHDGIPCGGEDVGVVVALIMSLQLLGEVFSGQLQHKQARLTLVEPQGYYPLDTGDGVNNLHAPGI